MKMILTITSTVSIVMVYNSLSFMVHIDRFVMVYNLLSFMVHNDRFVMVIIHYRLWYIWMAIVKTPSIEFLFIIHIIHVLWFCNGYNSLSFMVHMDGDCDDSIHGILNYVDIIHIQCDTPVTCTNKSLNSNFVLYLLSH